MKFNYKELRAKNQVASHDDKEKEVAHLDEKVPHHSRSLSSDGEMHYASGPGDGNSYQLHQQSTAEPEIHEKGVDSEQKALYDAFATKDEEYHKRLKKKLMWKVDLHLLPFLVAMYILNFLDRK